MSESHSSEEHEHPDENGEWTDPAVRLQELEEGEEPAGGGEGSVSTYSILQAFLVPAIIIGGVVVMFIGIRSLFTTGQSTEQLVRRITHGGGRGQWVAAAQLGKRLQIEDGLLNELRRDQEKKEAFREEFKRTNNKRLKIFLAQILGLIKDREATVPLERELERSTTDSVRVMILKALGDIGDPSSAQVIGTYIDSDSPAMRQAAVDAAGKLQHRDHIGLLVDRLGDQIPHVRLNAAIALSKYGTQTEVPIKRVVRTLVNYMDRETLVKQIKHADFQPPSLENNPMWGQDSDQDVRKQSGKIDRLQHVNRMRVSAIVALRRLISGHNGQMQFLKPEKSRDRILDRIRANIRSITGTSQKTSRLLRREARTLLSILNEKKDE